MHEMESATRRLLLALNRDFYATVAEPFNVTRLAWLSGTLTLLERLPHGSPERPVTIVDIGCGNGRFACMLDHRAIQAIYTGVDANAQLLAAARTNTAGLGQTRLRFVQVDISQSGWTQRLDVPSGGFDVVVCLATLQHMPGYALRLQVMRDLAGLTATDGLLGVSAWQFLTSDRFVTKQIDWCEIGLAANAVEPGDALLPWRQGRYAVRYVHQVDAAEMARLADAAGLDVVEMFRADGKEGNLNLYAVLRHR